MTVQTKLPYDQNYITNFSQAKEEPEWMRELRLEAFRQVDTLNLPEPDKTNINRWNFTEFKHGAEGERISSLEEMPAELKEHFDLDHVPENLSIHRNGTVAYHTVSEQLLNKGVIFTDLQTALIEHSDLIEQYYMKEAVKVDENKLTALHAAFMNGGVFIYVPKNVEIEEPLQTVFWQEDEEAALFNHVLIVVDENSKLTYVENYISSSGEQTVANVVTEVIAKDNAKVSFGGVDNFAQGTTTYMNRRGVAHHHAVIDWALGQMNDGYTVSENITELVGNHSSTNLRTVTVGRGRQIQNFTAITHHYGLDTNGEISQRGVLKDRTTSIFNAIGKIENGATRANAEQESRILMLSGDARGDANPILLIDEDDVTAGHAASVGRIDENQVYYLMSRGIPKEEAERLIIHGFLEPVVGELPIEAVKQQLTHLIERKIN